jgi:hypothetical protein
MGKMSVINLPNVLADEPAQCWTSVIQILKSDQLFLPIDLDLNKESKGMYACNTLRKQDQGWCVLREVNHSNRTTRAQPNTSGGVERDHQFFIHPVNKNDAE